MAESTEATRTEEIEGTRGESMQAVLEVEAAVDVRDPELGRESPHRLSEHGEEKNFVASEKETESRQTEAAVVPPAASASPPQSSPSTDETFSTVLVRGDEPGSTSESGLEQTEVTVKEEFVLNEENLAAKDKSFVESPARPDVSKDTDMDTTSSDPRRDVTNSDGNTDLGTNSNEDASARPDTESSGCKPAVSTADSLDEMMDIGTVDQVEQEAQMKEEEEQSPEMDVETSRSPTVSNAVSVADDSNSAVEEAEEKPAVVSPPAEEVQAKNTNASLESVQISSSRSSNAMTNTASDSNSAVEETEEKPAVVPPPAEEEQAESSKEASESKQSSQATASTGRHDLSQATLMNWMKVVKLSIPRLDAEKLRRAGHSIKLPPSPPLVKVKDEPVDEEYEQALVSSTSTANVKDEPSTTKGDLRIGSVFSVTQAAETQMLPILSPSFLHMSCSHCKKSLMKGQTAFQRKGSSALFCSTTCLTASLPTIRGPTKICHNCQKLIFRPQDVILAPDAKGAMKEFCSQNCLTSFNYKKNVSNYRKTASTNTQPQPVAPQSLCSMCTRYCISKHEVILSGAVHKLCSDACFNRFRTVNNLSMAGCAHCSSFCLNSPLLLKMDDSTKTLCNAECLTKYKEKTKVTLPCTMCRTARLLAEMVENRNSDNSVNLFCSISCVMAFKVQTVSASGARLNCDSCGKNTVPAYHLAMSDTSIRNFCTLPCVIAFQEKFKKSQKQVNVFTKLPVGATPLQTVTTSTTHPPQDVSSAPPKLNCSQCTSSITVKPELVQIKSDEIPKDTEQRSTKRPGTFDSNVEDRAAKRQMIIPLKELSTTQMSMIVSDLLMRVKSLEEKVNRMENMNDQLLSDNIRLRLALMKKS